MIIEAVIPSFFIFISHLLPFVGKYSQINNNNIRVRSKENIFVILMISDTLLTNNYRRSLLGDLYLFIVFRTYRVFLCFSLTLLKDLMFFIDCRWGTVLYRPKVGQIV